MRFKQYAGLAVFLPVVAGLGLPQASAQTYNFTSYDVSGASSTTINGINNTGTFVGSYGDSSEDVFGFVSNGSNPKTVPDPGYNPSSNQPDYLEALKINNAGAYVGNYNDSSGSVFGFISTVKGPVNYPGNGGISSVNGINNNGDTVGAYYDSNDVRHSYTEIGGTFTSFDVPNHQDSVANDINDKGAIVGITANDLSGLTESYLDVGGQFTFITIPSSPTMTVYDVYAEGINNAGDIVGYYDGLDNNNNFFNDGFLLSKGIVTTISYTGAAQTFVNDINDQGEIVGAYLDSTGVQHGFFATPAPEPSQFASLGLGIFGLGALALRARRRRVAA